MSLALQVVGAPRSAKTRPRRNVQLGAHLDLAARLGLARPHHQGRRRREAPCRRSRTGPTGGRRREDEARHRAELRGVARRGGRGVLVVEACRGARPRRACHCARRATCGPPGTARRRGCARRPRGRTAAAATGGAGPSPRGRSRSMGGEQATSRVKWSGAGSARRRPAARGSRAPWKRRAQLRLVAEQLLAVVEQRQRAGHVSRPPGRERERAQTSVPSEFQSRSRVVELVRAA